MKHLFLLLGILLLAFKSLCQDKTDISLFLKSDSSKYLEEISSESGDMFLEVGHHGPAIENEWFGLRIYFDQKCAIDVYSKSRPGLELKEARWYPTAEQQKDGWGADYYKVGATVGLGGVKLWDGKEILNLDPVTERTAKVYKKGGVSIMEMISKGIPYMGDTVDIMIRVKVIPNSRYAEVEAIVLRGREVQFVTGINYHNGNRIERGSGYIATWGIHPEDVAAEQIEVGGAILFEPDDFVRDMDDGEQLLLISKPTRKLNTRITSANGREPVLNNMDSFIDFLQE